MATYYVGGPSPGVTGAVANRAMAQLWNPHASIRLEVFYISINVSSVVANPKVSAIYRSSGRGATPTTTLTPAIAAERGREMAPPSGTVLELAAFGTYPTLDGAVSNEQWLVKAGIGSGIIHEFPESWLVPPGTGLCVVQTEAAVTPALEIVFGWRE